MFVGDRSCNFQPFSDLAHPPYTFLTSLYMIDGGFPYAEYFSSFLANNYRAIFRKQVIAMIMTVKNTLQVSLKRLS